jgi:hypothetical protein
MQPATCYIHGSAPAEQRRLSRLNELLNAAALRELDLMGARTLILSPFYIEEDAFDQAIEALEIWSHLSGCGVLVRDVLGRGSSARDCLSGETSGMAPD